MALWSLGMRLTYVPSTIRFVTACGVGAVFAVALVIGLEIHPILGLAVAGAPLLSFFVLNPKWLTLVTVFLLIVLEEFPWGLGETAERSSRTPFYATSLGVPGVYPPDILIFGSMFLLICRTVVTKRSFNLPNDRIQWAMIGLGVLLSISALTSLVFGNPFQFMTAVETGTVYKVNEQGAALIALFQFKNFSFLIFAYLLGLLYFESSRDVDQLLKVLFIALVCIVLIGFLRLVIRPSVITELKPLFYHSPSSWIFALAIFYWLIQALLQKINNNQLLIRLALSAVLIVFILLSYRRTMWGAMVVAALALLPMLPGTVRGKYARLLAAGVCGLLALVVIAPPLLNAIVARLSETSGQDVSTIYRLSLFVWFRHNLSEIPLMGYGLRALWDIAASLGYFRTNLENIHSLYFWIILRLGIVGFIGCILALMTISSQIRDAIRQQQDRPYFALCVVVALALVMLLFSGLFNPVYAEIRYIVLFGFALSFISRIPMIERNTHA